MALWDRITSRGNVDDRRANPAAIGGGLGIGGVALLLLFNYLNGGDLTDVLSQIDPSTLGVQTENRDVSEFEGNDEYEQFASTVLGSGNDVWTSVFSQQGKQYDAPKLVLFRTLTESGCGGADSRVGPHYCPLDGTIYLDETFFDELTTQLGAKGGDVAEAYVIAHEIGHHVQNELGLMDSVRTQQERNPAQENQLSVNLELQADCFAGIWANSLKDQNVFEQGEISEAIDAAEAVGDDRIQQKVNGQVNPESWTHGSSEQRVTWFNRGYDSGDFNQCNTFL